MLRSAHADARRYAPELAPVVARAMHAREREPILSSRDARDGTSTSMSASTSRGAIANARRMGVSVVAAVAIVACGAAGVIQRHQSGVSGQATDDARAARARVESPAWETEGGFDFTSLAIEAPWRVTAPPSDGFKRLSALGDGLKDESTLSEASSGLARMIGEAILDYQQGKEMKEYPRELGDDFKKSMQDFQRYQDTMTVKNDSVNATDTPVAKPVKAVEPVVRAQSAEKQSVNVAVAAATVDKSHAQAGKQTNKVTAASAPAKQTSNHEFANSKPARLGVPMTKERRARLKTNKDCREEIKRLQDFLLRIPDFVSDYGQDTFKSSIAVGNEVGGVYMSDEAQLQGLMLLKSYYVSEGQNLERNHTTPFLGVARNVEDEGQSGECRILYFYHIPRTGGGTLLSHFGRIGIDVERFERSKYARPDSALADDQDEDEDEHWRRVVNKSLQGGQHVIAHHVGRSGMLEMSEKLSSLRRQAASQGCSMKSFTVLREPLKHNLSLVASSRAKSYSDIVNAQTRFLLVNAGNKISKAWPQQLTSENSDLPTLLEESTNILEGEFDDVFTLDDIETLTSKISEFFVVGADQDAPLQESLRHISNYGVVADADIKAVRSAYETAQESDWLDDKIYSWARARSHD